MRDALDALERELVGLAPVKTRVREIAALLLVEKLRRQVGLQAEAPPLHMSFTGNPGTGKTTVAMKMASILHGLGYVRKGHLVAVTRDDLVGQYIGHTAPKTKEVLKRAMGGVLFIDEAYYLYRPENERDYGQEAIEILLQVMENQRDDLVVIFAGYKRPHGTLLRSNPGMASRVAHHIDFPDYDEAELFEIADAHAGAHALRARRRGGAGAARVHRAAPPPAALRQCALDAQRARPRPAAPGQAPVRAARRAAHRGRSHRHRAEDIRASRVFRGGAGREAH